MNEAMKVFEKTAGEMNGLQQRLESAYEDMGGVLNRYYKINEALDEAEEAADEKDIANQQAFNAELEKTAELSKDL